MGKDITYVTPYSIGLNLTRPYIENGPRHMRWLIHVVMRVVDVLAPHCDLNVIIHKKIEWRTKIPKILQLKSILERTAIILKLTVFLMPNFSSVLAPSVAKTTPSGVTSDTKLAPWQLSAWRYYIIYWSFHDDVIKWKHFPRYWPFVWGIPRSPVNSPHKGQWRGALMFSLICVWINGWVNSREAGDLRRHLAHFRPSWRHRNEIWQVSCSTYGWARSLPKREVVTM